MKQKLLYSILILLGGWCFAQAQVTVGLLTFDPSQANGPTTNTNPATGFIWEKTATSTSAKAKVVPQTLTYTQAAVARKSNGGIGITTLYGSTR